MIIEQGGTWSGEKPGARRSGDGDLAGGARRIGRSGTALDPAGAVGRTGFHPALRVVRPAGVESDRQPPLRRAPRHRAAGTGRPGPAPVQPVATRGVRRAFPRPARAGAGRSAGLTRRSGRSTLSPGMVSATAVQMAGGFHGYRRAMELIDRHDECGVLDGLLEAIRAGESRALVVSGEAGVGKTALLEYLSEQASGCLLARAAGVQSEMELPFAGLHQLCAPMLGNLPRLPPPQREALRIAFGMSAGSAPDRFLVGLAVLSLLSDTAEQQPLVCLVDDEQWLDRTSAQVLAFVAHRLVAESVALIFAARVPGSELMGLPELAVEPLTESDARALLDAALTAPLDSRARDRIVAETQGNPLALLELPRGLTPQQLAGGFGLPAAVRLSGGIEENFRQRIEALPP